MKLPASLKSVSIYEYCLFIIFTVYIVFPIETPFHIATYLDSALGMVIMFCITLYLFLYSNPVLGILFIFVSYEILRRSSSVTGRVPIAKYTPSQPKKDAELRAMNPPQERTLEEDIVAVRAPIGRSEPSIFSESSFKPVADNVGTASLI
jgi:hypothetical protein